MYLKCWLKYLMESQGCKNLSHIHKLNSKEMAADSNISTARNTEVVMAIRKYCSN
jgi:hypothetical protein